MNIFLTVFIAALFFASIPFPKTCCCGAVEVQIGDRLKIQTDELITIARAADRNNCHDDDFLILLAIRKAENGRPGREFGIKHRLCDEQIKRQPQRSLDIQAGWAAATIVKNRRRWSAAGRRDLAKGGEIEFIDFLADRYVPVEDDPKGNKNFKVNVKFFYERFKNNEN